MSTIITLLLHCDPRSEFPSNKYEGEIKNESQDNVLDAKKKSHTQTQTNKPASKTTAGEEKHEKKKKNVPVR